LRSKSKKENKELTNKSWNTCKNIELKISREERLIYLDLDAFNLFIILFMTSRNFCGKAFSSIWVIF
jgi:hypothetical protein